MTGVQTCALPISVSWASTVLILLKYKRDWFKIAVVNLNSFMQILLRVPSQCLFAPMNCCRSILLKNKFAQSSPPTPLNFSTNMAIFWNTLCFFFKYCEFSGLILGRVALSSVPFSLAYSRFSEVMIYLFAASSLRLSELINSSASRFCSV